MSNTGNIFKGHIKEFLGANQVLFAERYKICDECPKLTPTTLGETCGECGCRLQAKLRVLEESCPLSKW